MSITEINDFNSFFYEKKKKIKLRTMNCTVGNFASSILPITLIAD